MAFTPEAFPRRRTYDAARLSRSRSHSRLPLRSPAKSLSRRLPGARADSTGICAEKRPVSAEADADQVAHAMRAPIGLEEVLPPGDRGDRRVDACRRRNPGPIIGRENPGAKRTVDR